MSKTTASMNIYHDENSHYRNGKTEVSRSSRAALGELTNKYATRSQTAAKKASGNTKTTKSFTRSSAIDSVNTNVPSLNEIGAMLERKPRAADVTDIDAGDEEDPQQCSEYVEEIYQYLLQSQKRTQPSDNYMANQPDINERMRAILVDWMVDVHLKFKLVSDTLYLSNNYVDRFLEKKNVSRHKLQLVGITAMFIASKYEEVFAPEVSDFVYICDKAYKKDEILRMERLMLYTLGFNMNHPTPAQFMKRAIKAMGADHTTRLLAQYIMELQFQEYKMLKYRPSEIACSAVLIAHKMLGKRCWTSTATHYTSYTEAQLQYCVHDMIETVKKAPTARSLNAVYKKFCSSKLHAVATTSTAAL